MALVWKRKRIIITHSVDPNYILENAAREGNEKFCRLAKNWGANNFNRMLYISAKGGNEKLCRLAKEWGAWDYSGMLGYAVAGEHDHILRLAIEWGARYFILSSGAPSHSVFH